MNAAHRGRTGGAMNAVALLLAGAVLASPQSAKRRMHPFATPLSTQTCGMTSVPLNSEEPTCNSHNGRWISVSETGPGGTAYWTPTPLAHPTFNYADGVVGLPDGGTYLISTEVPVASDCGVTVTVNLKI